MKITKLFLCIALALLWTKSALACSCRDYYIPPCAAYWGVDAVFIGLVTEVTAESPDSGVGGAIVHFTVEQAFRGIKVAKVEVIAPGENSSCNMGFKAGQRWLVYADRAAGGRLATGPCIRTTPLPADEDLAYITKVSGQASMQSILGRVGKSQFELVEGVKVIVEGISGKHQAVTDKEGKFNFNLPQPGTYKVRLFIPYSAFVMNISKDFEEIKSEPTEKLTVAEYEVTLPANQCDYRLIVAPEKDLKATAEISGKVLDSEGQPVTDQTIYLYPATSEQDFSSGGYKYTQTNKEGIYTFTGLREGRYWLGVNIGQIPEVNSPFPTTFYPGTQDLKGATVVTLKQGQKLSRKDIQLPPRLVEREITGSIVWPDGRPALAPPPGSENSGLRPDIYIRDPKRLWYPPNPRRNDGTSIEKVDDGGHFSFIGFEGYTYVIFAVAHDGEGKMVRSKAVKLRVTADTKPLVLVLTLTDRAGEKELKKELGDKP
ncbi:MAG TPA: hypothetical protein VF791_21450 [Pyrinomonadaceae bacterium]